MSRQSNMTPQEIEQEKEALERSFERSESKELEKRISTEDMRAIQSFDDAIKLVTEQLGGTVEKSSELGDGFTLQDDKDFFVGKACVFMMWKFSKGDYGDMATVRVLVQEGRETGKYVINDGSTGIRAQLRDLEKRDPNIKMIVAPRGLRRSDFKYTGVDEQTGEVTEKPAHTYYIDTSEKGKQ